jgi:Plant transposon protein
MQISSEFEALGFPGCIGSVDCASWYWDMCPMAWQCQCRGKDKKPDVRMEVVCDDYLRICWLNFGVRGSKNDVQIYHSSNLFNNIRTGQWPPFCPKIDTPGFTLLWFHFLCDGIYPRRRFLMSSLSRPTTAAENLYCG